MTETQTIMSKNVNKIDDLYRSLKKQFEEVVLVQEERTSGKWYGVMFVPEQKNVAKA